MCARIGAVGGIEGLGVLNGRIFRGRCGEEGLHRPFGFVAPAGLVLHAQRDMTTRDRGTTYSIAEAARLLDVPPGAVREAIARGMIRAVMVGKAIHVPIDEIKRMLVNSARHAEDLQRGR